MMLMLLLLLSLLIFLLVTLYCYACSIATLYCFGCLEREQYLVSSVHLHVVMCCNICEALENCGIVDEFLCLITKSKGYKYYFPLCLSS